MFCRRRGLPPKTVRPSYNTTFSSEGISEEENTSERERHLTPDVMLSSLSTENLQLELVTSCHSDGLSDKENTVRRMKNQAKRSPERTLPVCKKLFI